MDSPADLAAKAGLARTVEVQLSDGTDLEKVRFHGWARIAVPGHTEQECLDRCADVANLYRQENVEIAHPHGPQSGGGQRGLFREFVPGQSVASTAYRRRQPVAFFAAGVPTATSEIGDGRGPYIGRSTSVGRRPVMHDPHYPMEVLDRPGLVPIVGEPGAGKALALDTPLPTPSGWTTMGEVQVGDELIGADGRPTAVIAATEVLVGRPCYDVEFSDGTTITADAQHQWLTRDRRSYMDQWRRERHALTAPVAETREGYCRCGCGEKTKRRTRRKHGKVYTYEPNLYLIGHRRSRIGDGPDAGPSVVTTEQLAASVRLPGGRVNHVVQVAEPFALPDAALPIAPYALGAWLGDGASCQASIVIYEDEIATAIENDGQAISRSANYPHIYWLTGSMPILRALGVLNAKHIPPLYLRASEQQRRDLLAGLLDTDGTCGKSGQVEFAVTDERLARDVLELVRSLGYRAAWRTKPCPGGREGRRVCYTVSFTAADKVFRLTRKLARQVTTGDARRRYRYITAVRPAESVPVRCVQVDNDDHLYLASEACIPTHNSMLTGLIGYEGALRGISTTAFDPSGLLAKLCYLPQLRARARHVDLMTAPAGTLNLYPLVPDPTREGMYDDESTALLEASLAAQGIGGDSASVQVGDHVRKLFVDAQQLAVAARMELAQDILMMLLPEQDVVHDETPQVITEAVRAVGGSRDANLDAVVDQVRQAGKHGARLASTLDAISRFRRARLFFAGDSGGAADYDNDVLVIFTMAGITMPRGGADRRSWTVGERLAIPLLHTATLYTSRRVYERPRGERKIVLLDEVGQTAGWEAAQAFFTRLGVDSRKANAAVILGSQNPSHILGMDIANYVGTSFIGRILDAEIAAEALRFARIPTGIGYEATIHRLSPDPAHGEDAQYREFIHTDAHGRSDVIRVDVKQSNPALFEALYTTPGTRAAKAEAAAAVPLNPAVPAGTPRVLRYRQVAS
jgi:hypothetical protein